MNLHGILSGRKTYILTGLVVGQPPVQFDGDRTGGDSIWQPPVDPSDGFWTEAREVLSFHFCAFPNTDRMAAAALVPVVQYTPQSLKWSASTMCLASRAKSRIEYPCSGASDWPQPRWS